MKGMHSCPKCSYNSPEKKFVKLHLNRKHGLTPVNDPVTGTNPYYPGCVLRKVIPNDTKLAQFERNKLQNMQTEVSVDNWLAVAEEVTKYGSV